MSLYIKLNNVNFFFSNSIDMMSRKELSKLEINGMYELFRLSEIVWMSER